MSLSSLKEEGNEAFKAGKYEDALDSYTKVLGLIDIKDTDKAIVYKNRAMCHLKLDQYKDAARDATSSLDIHPNDPKALYRRCVAYEHLNKLEEAYKDAAILFKVDPKNTSIKPILNRLTPIIRERAQKQGSTGSNVAQMLGLLADPTSAKDKKIQAANNLVVVSREPGGCEVIVAQGGVSRINGILATDKDTDLLQAAVRVLAGLTHESRPRSEMVYSEVGVVRLGQLMAMPSEALCTSVTHCLQNMILCIAEYGTFKDTEDKFKEKRAQGDPAIPPKFQIDEFQQKFVDEVFHGLVKMLLHAKVSAEGRDSAMELLIKTVTRKTGVHWTKNFLETEGIEALLTITGAIKQHQMLSVTQQSKMHASLLLNKIWEDLIGEKESSKFKDKVSEFFKELFGNEDWESKVEAIKTISMLLQGPFDVGNMILGFEGVTHIMFALAASDRALYQQVAVEAIVNSASKKDRCSGMLKDAVPILKKLYHEGLDDNIKVRALVGLCKLGSFGGSDASNRPMADGSTVTLAKSCRKFLSNPMGNQDMKQWGTEGLAYLTLDAEVKEDLVHDEKALRAVMEAASNPKPSFMYTAAALFVNLTNSIDKQEVAPEMVELAKFAKQHVPEDHAKDGEEYVKERVRILVEAGMIGALSILAKADSPNTREQVSRVYLTVAVEEGYRGQIVQAGGVKVLLSLSLDNNTDLGKQASAQTLAKIAITQDPTITFAGQRMYEVVRPLVTLLHNDRTGLQNFEALLALTNLSSISDSVRSRIVAERGIPNIENYLYEEHELIQRAAIECMCNMVMNEKVAKLFEGENDRVKLFVILCGDEDEKIVIAASGALAFLSENLVICKKILAVKSWIEIIMSVVVNENSGIQHRGCHIVRNMVASDLEVAETVLAGQMLEVMMAVSILEAPDKQDVRRCALDTLKSATEYGIIKQNEES